MTSRQITRKLIREASLAAKNKKKLEKFAKKAEKLAKEQNPSLILRKLRKGIIGYIKLSRGRLIIKT